MGKWLADRGGCVRFNLSFVFSVVLLISVAACAGSSAPPETEPSAPERDANAAERTNTPVGAEAGAGTSDMEQLRQNAEGFYASGEEAYRRADYATADQQFQRALDVYVDADVLPADRQPRQDAFNDLFNRINALRLEGLFPVSDELVDIDDEELPAPSAEHLAELRARLEVSPPELPKFSISVPSPLENERVEWALAYLTGERREVIEEGLSRATAYMPMIEAIFDEVGVPREFAWVPLIESLFKNGAYSRAAAVGMWQFVSGTARLYGMKVDYNLDERRDPVMATRQAAIYMKDLYGEFRDWPLVLAAYNAGKGRIGRAMERTGADDFWTLAEERSIPRETRDHVPKIYAAILIGTDPEVYGLNVVQQPLYVYDESIMEANTDLRLIADLAGLSFEEIRELNPHIMAWVPKDYAVRIPAGTRRAFESALADVPPAELLQFYTHRVARGETLSAIAGQYPGTRMAAIVEVNNLRNPNRLSIGQELVIPVGPESRPYRPQPVAGFDTGELTTYRVQRGDSLHQIAQTFRTDIPNLMRWNDLATDRIYPGDDLIVYYGVRGDMATPAAVSNTAGDDSASSTSGDNGGTATSPERGIYTVRRGDSFYLIAQRFDVTVNELKSWNNRRSNTIHPGDKLVVYSAAAASGNGAGRANTTVQQYTVRRGDSPYEIAQRYNVNLDALLTANGLTRRSSIYPGDQLLIPGGGASAPASLSYTVRRGDTLSAIADSHGISLRSLLQANSLSSRSVIHPGETLLIPRR